MQLWLRASRGISLLALFLLIPLGESFTPQPAEARGLYVGHGRRSVDEAWSVRFNLSGGLHGATDPWNDEISDSSYPFGGYGTAGIEFNVGYDNSLEVYASLRDIEDRESFLEFDDFGFTGDAGRYRYDLETESAGLTLRHRYPTRGGASYWGVGGGVVRSTVRYSELLNGFVSDDREEEDTAGEAHALLGWDSRLAPALSLGLELGFRYTWLEYELFDDTGNTTGFFGGVRLGIVFGN